MVFPFAFACPQHVSREVSKTRVLWLVGLRPSKSSAWEMFVMCGNLLLSHEVREQEEQVPGTLLRDDSENLEVEE